MNAIVLGKTDGSHFTLNPVHEQSNSSADLIGADTAPKIQHCRKISKNYHAPVGAQNTTQAPRPALAERCPPNETTFWAWDCGWPTRDEASIQALLPVATLPQPAR